VKDTLSQSAGQSVAGVRTAATSGNGDSSPLALTATSDGAALALYARALYEGGAPGGGFDGAQ
jgi:hypothetical protein